jgi:hypothetical protein
LMFWEKDSDFTVNVPMYLKCVISLLNRKGFTLRAIGV